MTDPLNPDLDFEMDDIDFLIDEERENGAWDSMEAMEERELLEGGPADA